MANKKRTTGKAGRQHAFEQDANLVREAIRRTVQEVLEEEMTQLLGVAKSERTGSRSGYRSAPATTSSPGDPRGAHRAAHSPLLPRLPAAYPVSPRVHGNGVDPDGTDLNFVEHPGCVGLGLISRNKGSAGTLGIHTHSTLVANGEGIPLGVPQIQYEAPDGKAEQGKPLEERKTMRWVRGLRECAELAQQLHGVRPVSVMDREGDVYAIFAEQRRPAVYTEVLSERSFWYSSLDSLSRRARSNACVIAASRV